MSQRIVVTGTETVSDKIVNFQTNIEYPFSDVSVAFSPVQDLHGYDAPWPAGGGKNLSTASAEGSGTYVGVTFVYSGNTITASGTATGGNAEKTISIVPVVLKANTQYVLGFGHRGLIKNIRILGVAYNPYPKEYITLQFTEDTTVSNFVLRLNSSSGVAINDSWDWQLEQGSTPTAYIPYSNICPISGWTDANIHVSPTQDAEDGNTYTISWQTEAGTVYGGTLNVTSGVLTVDKGIVDFGTANWSEDPNRPGVFYANIGKLKNSDVVACSIYKVENISVSTSKNDYISGQPSYGSTSVFFRDTRLAGYTRAQVQTELSGQTIIYYLATPQTYQLTPTQVQTLAGGNHVWSSVNGNTTITYSDGYYIDYISKIIYGDKIILDLTSDTITEPKLLTGYTAHRADGEYIEGSLPWRTVVQETLLYLDRASISQQTLNTDGSVTGTTLIL